MGLDDTGDTVRFPANSLSGIYKGIAQTTTNPGTPVLGQIYLAAGPGTYTNFKDSTNTAIVVPDTVSTKKVVNATFTYNAGAWVLRYDLIDAYAFSDGSITPVKTSFVTTNSSKNLFNPADANVSLGHVLSGAGGTSVNASFNLTGFIPVVAGLVYTVSDKYTLQWYSAASGASFISESPSSDSSKQQTAPAGANFMRSNVAIAKWATFQVEQNSSQTSYEAWYTPYLTINNGKASALTAALQAVLDAKYSPLPVNTAAIQDSAVTPVKTSFFDVSPNLFNPNDVNVSLGHALSGAGGSAVNASFNLTGFIPVIAGQTYTVSDKYTLQWYSAATGASFISESASSDTAKQQVAPAGAAFMRSNVAIAKWATFQVELGTSATNYKPYGQHTVKPANLQQVNYTNGAERLFLRERLSTERQIFKIGIYGDSIFDTGHGTVSFPDEFGLGQYEQGYGRLDQDGIERRIYNYLNFNKPVWRNCRHTDWTYTGAVSNITSGILPNRELLKLMGDTSVSNVAQITITGKATVVFVFEGGAVGQSQQTGPVYISVSRNGGSFVNPSTLLKGALTNKGFGTTQIFNTAPDSFDTSFTQPDTLTANNVYAPCVELVFNGLITTDTYVFKLTRIATDLPVRLWGCYSFTGQTLIVHNRCKSGLNWLDLNRNFYSDFVVSKTDWVIMESPMYHDPDLYYAETQANAFIAKVKSYGVQLALTSCPPGGVATTGAAAAVLGDTNSVSYAPGLNFYLFFNRYRSFVPVTMSSGEVPVNGDVYTVTINGVAYSVYIQPGNTTTALFVNVLENFPVAPTFPLTLTKVSGASASRATIVINSQLPFYTMEQHRDLMQKICYQQGLKFIDLLQAFADLAASVGETLGTPGYTMDSGHPLYNSVVAAALDTANYPGLTAPFKMNYMSNYFLLGDGHHMQAPAGVFIFDLLRMALLSNCVFKA